MFMFRKRLKAENNGNLFKCELCNLEFETKSIYLDHCESHFILKNPIKIEKSDSIYNELFSIQNKEVKKPECFRKCHICQETFETKKQYLTHAEHHTIVKEEIPINVAVIISNDVSVYNCFDNQRSQSNLGNFLECKICHESFKTKKHYLNHSGLHSSQINNEETSGPIVNHKKEILNEDSLNCQNNLTKMDSFQESKTFHNPSGLKKFPGRYTSMVKEKAKVKPSSPSSRLVLKFQRVYQVKRPFSVVDTEEQESETEAEPNPDVLIKTKNMQALSYHNQLETLDENVSSSSAEIAESVTEEVKPDSSSDIEIIEIINSKNSAEVINDVNSESSSDIEFIKCCSATETNGSFSETKIDSDYPNQKSEELRKTSEKHDSQSNHIEIPLMITKDNHEDSLSMNINVEVVNESFPKSVSIERNKIHNNTNTETCENFNCDDLLQNKRVTCQKDNDVTDNEGEFKEKGLEGQIKKLPEFKNCYSDISQLCEEIKSRKIVKEQKNGHQINHKCIQDSLPCYSIKNNQETKISSCGTPSFCEMSNLPKCEANKIQPVTDVNAESTQKESSCCSIKDNPENKACNCDVLSILQLMQSKHQTNENKCPCYKNHMPVAKPTCSCDSLRNSKEGNCCKTNSQSNCEVINMTNCKCGEMNNTIHKAGCSTQDITCPHRSTDINKTHESNNWATQALLKLICSQKCKSVDSECNTYDNKFPQESASECESCYKRWQKKFRKRRKRRKSHKKHKSYRRDYKRKSKKHRLDEEEETETEDDETEEEEADDEEEGDLEAEEGE